MLRQLTSISILLFLLGANGTAFADFPHEWDNHEMPQQTSACTGTVKDENGESIIGATVIKKGTTNGTITDMDGEFTLEGQTRSVYEKRNSGIMTCAAQIF